VRRRRWHRAAVPLGLALLLFAGTGIAHAVEYPDPAHPGFLAPGGTAPAGGSRLADELRARGVTVQRETRTSDALVAARQGEATLFLPAPTLVHPSYLSMLSLLPTGTRIVLVDPPARVLDGSGIPLATAGRRWATRATGPDGAGQTCAVPEARRAGVAAALRQRYVARADDPVPLGRCYDAGLVRLRWATGELTVIGASDPFRNDRIREHNNAALAAGLLGTNPRVIWLDLPAPEPPPGVVDEPVTESAAPPSPTPGPDGGVPQDGYPGDQTATGVPGEPGAGDGGPAALRAAQRNPLWDAFPPWFWALLVQLALAILALALWRARRLAPPVAEPLPVTVRSAETVLGRGRLYRRARARGPSANILRDAALARIVPLLDLPADAPPADVVSAVAAQTGHRAEEIGTLLYGPPPQTDDDLLHLARALDALPHTVSAPPAAASDSPLHVPHDRTDEGVNR
jgi:hypothetical protein